MRLDDLFEACRQLPIDERILLVQQLWDSIERDQPGDELADLTPEQCADLDRALAEYRADPAAGATWEEAKARILAGL